MPNPDQEITLLSTNRNGGISHRPFQSLNLSYGVGDDLQAVAENRKRLNPHLKLNTLISAKQVHGDALFVATQNTNTDVEVPNVDALLTDIPGIGLMIQQADCQAVTLFDPVHSAIAAIHCGWKGSVLNILSKTVQKMHTQYNSLPSELHACISPSLGPCCAEFTNHATELPSSFLAFQVKENYFDFWKISEKQLMDSGLIQQNIVISGKCTSCLPDFFSYRRACRKRDGQTGRCATVIALS
jgi:YfiH family protein